MIDRFGCHVGDTGRPIQVELIDASETPMNLAGCTVTFSMKHKQTLVTKVANSPCVIADAANGVVRYEFADADVDTAGTYLGWFTVTNADGKPITFPSGPKPRQFYEVIIEPTFTIPP